jgi:hypothetical protein
MWQVNPARGAVRAFTCDGAGRDPVRIHEIRPVEPAKNTLHAWLRVQQPDGMILDGCGLHIQGNRCWVSPPAGAWVKAGELVRDPKGRPIYHALVSWSHGGQRIWSEQIILALRRQHPDLLPLYDDAQHEADVAREWLGRQS